MTTTTACILGGGAATACILGGGAATACILGGGAATAKPIVLLATTMVDAEGIWRNGLFQNVFLLYKLFEAAGFDPQLFINNPTEYADSPWRARFKVVSQATLSDPGSRIHAVLEIGLNLNPELRRLFKTHGARIAKLYLGNILNIDIEIPMYFNNEFAHHVSGGVDAVYLSPHYAASVEYARVLNRLTDVTTARTVPYVWEPYFLTRDGALNPRGTYGDVASPTVDFTVIEPNISFQKSSLLPLLMIEQFHRRHPGRVGSVVVVNGDILAGNPFFAGTVRPQLTLGDKVTYAPRMTIQELVKAHPAAIVVHHQVTNSLNYLDFEHLYMGFPYVHNSEELRDAGYFYPGNDIEAGASAIERAVETHAANGEAYRAAAREVIWRYSIYNPANITEWRSILRDKV